MNMIIGLGIVLILVVLYAVSFLENKNTKKPAGCDHLLEECHSCTFVSCGHNKKQ